MGMKFFPTGIETDWGSPDNKRQSYDAMFSLLKMALECRGLQLSAEYFMSDFEIAIRDSFVNHSPQNKAKSCAFHFAKAIISKVKSNGFKSDFSNTKVLEFSAFVGSILGLAYTKLSRFREAIRSLYILASRLKTGRHRRFANEVSTSSSTG